MFFLLKKNDFNIHSRYFDAFLRHKLDAEWFLSDNTTKLKDLGIKSLTDREIMVQEVVRLRQTIDFKKRPYFENVDLGELDFETMIQEYQLNVTKKIDEQRQEYNRKAQIEAERKAQFEQRRAASSPLGSTLRYSKPLPVSQPSRKLDRDADILLNEEYLQTLAPNEVAFPTANARLRHNNEHIQSISKMGVTAIPRSALVVARIGMIFLLILLLPMYPFAYLSDPSAVIGTTRVLLIPTLLAIVVSGTVLWVMVLGQSPYLWLALQLCIVANILQTGIVILTFIKSSSFSESHDYGAVVVAILTTLVIIPTALSLLVAMSFISELKLTVCQWSVEQVALWAASHGIDFLPLFESDVTGLVLMDTNIVELAREIYPERGFDQKLFEQQLTLLKTGGETFYFTLKQASPLPSVVVVDNDSDTSRGSDGSSNSSSSGSNGNGSGSDETKMTETAIKAASVCPIVRNFKLHYITGSNETKTLLVNRFNRSVSLC